MNTKLIIVLFIIACQATVSIKAQGTIYSEDFINASKFADKAEFELAKGNLKLADNYYDTLFSLMPNPSGRDVWNRALLAKDLGNKSLEDSLTRTLLRKGYPVAELEKCFDPRAFEHLITPEYLAKRKAIEEVFERILEEDQRLNSNKQNKPQEFVDGVIRHAKEIMEFTRNNQTENSYYSLETANEITSLHLMAMIGQAKLKRLTTPHIVLARNINLDSLGYFSFLAYQVETGNFHRESLASLANDAKIESIHTDIVHQFDNELFVWDPLKLRKGVLDTISNNRRCYGLCSYSDYFEKVKNFAKNNFKDDIFTSVTHDRLMEIYSISCNYNVVGFYRRMYTFTKPEYSNRILSSRRKRYYKIEFQ